MKESEQSASRGLNGSSVPVLPVYEFYIVSSDK